MTTVSIVINAYNYERFLTAAIESALRQQGQGVSVEIIVIDDGSTDGTPGVAARYAGRIRYHRQANAGQAAAIQAGIGMATGEALCLLDADDEFADGKVQKVIMAFQGSPQCGAVYNSYIHTDAEGGSLGPPFIWGVAGKDVRQYGLFWLAAGVPTSCISLRRELAQKLVIPAEFKICADTYILVVLPQLTKISWIGEPLTSYRLHGENAYAAVDSRQQKNLSLKNWRAIYSTLKNQYGIELAKAVFEIQEQRERGHLLRAIGCCIEGFGYAVRADVSAQLKMREVLRLIAAIVGLRKPLTSTFDHEAI
jgi:glycosyltransferase involved in cell wall biosynthesis